MASPALPRPLLSLLQAGVFLSLTATATAAQTEFPYAAGTDSTGRAQAVSDAAGRVLIESPRFPRGLWVELVDEAGQALAGIQIEYEGLPYGRLVAIRCVDPSGVREETLLWTDPIPWGRPLSLSLRSTEPADLPTGMASINWQIDRSVEPWLESSRLVGWGAVETFLRERWQAQAGRVVVKLDDAAAFVDLDNFRDMGKLVTHLQQRHQPETASLADNPIFGALAHRGSNNVILYTSLFEDEPLERSVRGALGRWKGRIAPEEIASLSNLQNNQAEGDILSLAGLEHFTNLERLVLTYNQIVDVSPLASLTNLDRLVLINNQIVDVSPLASLTKLQQLLMEGNQIVDVSPLASLTKLRRLKMEENQIVDVSALASLTNLEGLVLNYNQIVDVSGLASLTNLAELELSHNQIVDVSSLASLVRLHDLALSNNQISDVGPLASLNLSTLYLLNNEISDIAALASVPNLWQLYLGGNQITDFSALASLTNLGWLNLRYNRITDISPSLVANMDFRADIDLKGNPLSDQAINEQIPALRARGVDVTY